MTPRKSRDNNELLILFTQRLKNAREIAELSQAQVAEAMGISRTKYQSFERGDAWPRYDEILDLVEILGRAENYFFPGVAIQFNDNIYLQKLNEIREEHNNAEERLKALEEGQEEIKNLLTQLLNKL